MRADFTPRGGRRSRRGWSWRQELEESPFERILAEAHDLARAGADGRRHARGDRAASRSRAAGARFGAVAVPRRRQAAGRRGALDGPRRGCRRDERWWGWGEDGHDVAAARARAGAAARPSSGSTRRRHAAGGARGGARCPSSRCSTAPARGGWPAVVGEEHVRDDRAARVGHAAGRSYPDLVRLRAGDARRRARRRGASRARADEVARAARGLRGGARGRGPVRRRHERGGRRRAAARTASRRVDLARPARGSTA